MKKAIQIFAGVLALVLLGAFTGHIVHDERTRVPDVTFERADAFYEGVDNPIHIRVEGVPDSEVVVRVSDATIAPGRLPGDFIVHVDSGAHSVMLRVSVVKKSNVRTHAQGESYDLEYRAVRVKKIQDPVTYINHVHNDGVILKEDLQTITGVFTRLVNCDFDCAFKPQSFSMSVIEEGEWKEYKATGPVLTDEMKAALKKCEEEDRIIFHNVMTKGPAGDVRHVNCVTITVK